MSATALPTEQVAVLGRVNPQTVAFVEKFSDVVDMQKFELAIGIALLGTMTPAETVTMNLYTCASDGTGAVLLKTVTLNGGAGNSNTQIKMGLRAEDLASPARHVKFSLVTSGGVGGPAALVVLGLEGRHKRESVYDLASVAAVVA